MNRYTFTDTEHVLIGDVPVRGYKHNQQWRFVDLDVQKAGRRLAGLRIDPGDLVDATLDSGEPRSWRSLVDQWTSRGLYEAGLAQEPGTKLPEGFSGQQLPDNITRRTVASTRPLPLMVWSGTVWLIPRAYAALLDRADEAAAGLMQRDEVCSGCGTAAGCEQWRSSSAAGYVVLCPSCAAQASRPYQGHLQGRRYTKAFSRRSPAAAFLCQTCPEPRRALYWDHCHVHELFRGPLCVKCNNAEGGSGFIDRPGAVEHLLRCTGCRTERTLPPQHHGNIVRQLSSFEPLGACDHERSWRWSYVQDDGSVLTRFYCYLHPQTLEWSIIVPAEEVGRLVRRFVDAALGSGL
ncbi:endonuclease VII domain-containing protein [Streptomyces sp. G2]|uniref:endonuclease domain-containing protein n=1 Tax=Streptomyces sp. G2 TaxID=1684471 RepID=UPI00202F4B47|nr:endonuclease domain-containing protein [Streptomyces sp. G2]MCM1950407.1 endonuclease VII domain-containing protein [Streptomyces sp. G2]